MWAERRTNLMEETSPVLRSTSGASRCVGKRVYVFMVVDMDEENRKKHDQALQQKNLGHEMIGIEYEKRIFEE